MIKKITKALFIIAIMLALPAPNRTKACCKNLYTKCMTGVSNIYQEVAPPRPSCNNTEYIQDYWKLVGSNKVNYAIKILVIPACALMMYGTWCTIAVLGFVAFRELAKNVFGSTKWYPAPFMTDEQQNENKLQHFYSTKAFIASMPIAFLVGSSMSSQLQISKILSIPIIFFCFVEIFSSQSPWAYSSQKRRLNRFLTSIKTKLLEEANLTKPLLGNAIKNFVKLLRDSDCVHAQEVMANNKKNNENADDNDNKENEAKDEEKDEMAGLNHPSVVLARDARIGKSDICLTNVAHHDYQQYFDNPYNDIRDNTIIHDTGKYTEIYNFNDMAVLNYLANGVFNEFADKDFKSNATKMYSQYTDQYKNYDKKRLDIVREQAKNLNSSDIELLKKELSLVLSAEHHEADDIEKKKIDNKNWEMTLLDLLEKSEKKKTNISMEQHFQEDENNKARYNSSKENFAINGIYEMIIGYWVSQLPQLPQLISYAYNTLRPTKIASSLITPTRGAIGAVTVGSAVLLWEPAKNWFASIAAKTKQNNITNTKQSTDGNYLVPLITISVAIVGAGFVAYNKYMMTSTKKAKSKEKSQDLVE
jgi:hypothetical protein